MDPLRRKEIHDALVRLSDGDRSAFPVLIAQLWPVILAFAQRGVGQAQDAEDVAQEVFLRICSRIADFDRERDGLSWAFGIATYEIMTHRRRRQRRRESDGGDSDLRDHADPAASQEESVVGRQLASALSLAAGSLSDEDRLALGLIAKSTSPAMAPGGATLRKRRQRALERLRATWRRLHGEP